MAIREIELDQIGQAIIDTNKEIAAEAWGNEEIVEDESGDRSPETMGEGLEGQRDPDDDDEPESDEDDGEESEDGEDEPSRDDKTSRDDKGKFSAKDVADKDAADKTAAEKSAAEQAAKGERDGKVPSGRLREQTERATAAEAARDAAVADAKAARDEVKALSARFDGMLATLQRQQQPAAKEQDTPKADALPDPLIDPEGFRTALQRGYQTELSKRDQQIEVLRIETSMQIAAGRHGETFTKAYDAVGKLDRTSPDDQATVRRIWASPNPGEELVRWHRRTETLREVGEDPAAYKARIAQETREALMKDPEFRKQLVESLQQEASGADGRPARTITRLPRSLNGAPGGNSARNDDQSLYDDSDQAVADSAWR